MIEVSIVGENILDFIFYFSEGMQMPDNLNEKKKLQISFLQIRLQRFLWCKPKFCETVNKTESISCENKKIQNPELRQKPSPVNTKFPDLKPRLGCK